MERPVLLLSETDATRLGLELAGLANLANSANLESMVNLVTVTGEHGHVILPATVQPGWPSGLVGLPAGSAPPGLAHGRVTLTPGPGSTSASAEEARP